VKIITRSDKLQMGKKEEYFKQIQEISINNMDSVVNYLKDVEVFLKQQKINLVL
jgi:hypothetical protein